MRLSVTNTGGSSATQCTGDSQNDALVSFAWWGYGSQWRIDTSGADPGTRAIRNHNPFVCSQIGRAVLYLHECVVANPVLRYSDDTFACAGGQRTAFFAGTDITVCFDYASNLLMLDTHRCRPTDTECSELVRC